MVSKIRLQSASDDELVERRKKEVNCGECRHPEWMNPTKDVKMNPPENTLAVVVDVRSSQGAMHIMDSSNRYVDGVGTEEAGNMIMIRWDKEWWFYCIGTTRVAYIRPQA